MKNIVNEYRLQAYDNLYGVFSKENIEKCDNAANLIYNDIEQILFIGNGGSHASCCLHISEDFFKVASIPSFALENPSLITCLSNDYGYENVYEEWLKRFDDYENTLLIAISSSGNSKNIINGVKYFNKINGFKEKSGHLTDKVITFSSQSLENELLKETADIKFHLPTFNYGAAEIYHSMWLHMILDRVVELNRKQN